MSERIEIGVRLEHVGDTTPDWDEMIRQIDTIAAQYGCKVRQYGPWSMMKQAVVEEAEFMETIMRHVSDLPDNVPGKGWVVLGDKEAESPKGT